MGRLEHCEFTPSEIAQEVKVILTEDEMDAEWVTPSKVGRVMSRMRFQRQKESTGKRRRMWVVRKPDLCQTSTAYGLCTRSSLSTGVPSVPCDTEKADGPQRPVTIEETVGDSVADCPSENSCAESSDEASDDAALRTVEAEALAQRIRETLAGRQLPIEVAQGQTITDVNPYASVEARNALSDAEAISRPARERLERLGIDLARGLQG